MNALARTIAELDDPDATVRATAAALLGAGSRRWPNGTTARLADVTATDPDPRVRAHALGALVARGGRTSAARAWARAAQDADVTVRRRVAQLAGERADRDVADEASLLSLLADRDGLVAEAAAFALGERAPTDLAIAALVDAAGTHADALVREAAVAALGALGDERGLPTLLAACNDKPAVRRRAVLALASFEGPEVDAALEAALHDRDWQVRDAAEDLLG